VALEEKNSKVRTKNVQIEWETNPIQRELALLSSTPSGREGDTKKREKRGALDG